MNLSPHPSWAGAGLTKEVRGLGCHGASLLWARASSGASKFIPSLRGGFGVGHQRALGRAKAARLVLSRPSVASSGIQGCRRGLSPART